LYVYLLEIQFILAKALKGGEVGGQNYDFAPSPFLGTQVEKTEFLVWKATHKHRKRDHVVRMVHEA
jgi:hypothetical protein